MPHFEGLGGNLVVAARAPVGEVATFAREKGWKHTRLVSAARTSFRRDYGGDGPDGEPVPIMTVFRRDADGVIRLHWASELVHAPTDPGQDMRHLGTVEPLWTLFDLTPGGRPNADEQIEYSCCRPPAASQGHNVPKARPNRARSSVSPRNRNTAGLPILMQLRKPSPAN
jgi:predicted dithiol-disulfide oxidoreductase (DUF899 family)